MRDITVFNEISAKDLDILVRTREQKQREVFILVLERIYSRIRRCAYVSMCDCRFDFPEVVYGHPMFDIERCIKFAIRHLVMNGFKVSRTIGSHQSIDIMWGASAIAATKRDQGLPIAGSKQQHSTTNVEHPVDRSMVPTSTKYDDDMLVSISRRKARSPSPHRPIDSLVTRNIIPSSR